MELHIFHYSVLVILIVMCGVNCVPVNIKNGLDNLKYGKNLSASNTSTTKLTKEQKKFQKQLRTLFKLGCKPKQFKVYTRTLIDSTNPLHDVPLVYPEFVVVQKCDESCSFCKLKGDIDGKEVGVCTAKVSKEKSYIVKYWEDNEWKYTNVKAQEDRKCECKDKLDY